MLGCHRDIPAIDVEVFLGYFVGYRWTTQGVSLRGEPCHFVHNYVFELRVKICRKTLGSIAFHDCSFQSQGEMQVQAESDTSNCYS